MVAPWITRAAFTALTGCVAVQRLREVRRSRENERVLLSRGGRHHEGDYTTHMTVLHTAWLVSGVAEVWLERRVLRPGWAILAGAAFYAGQGLRKAAMRELDSRWCIRVLTLPGRGPVRSGIYRFMRHPNYAGVALEIAALPMLHGAKITACVFSVLDALLLRARIRMEERALAASGDGAAFQSPAGSA